MMLLEEKLHSEANGCIKVPELPGTTEKVKISIGTASMNVKGTLQHCIFI